MPQLTDPGLFLNRELALLEFNRRVLAQARDPELPPLERLRFLTICSTNLDEFFEIRAAGLKEQVTYGVQQLQADGLTPQETLRRISVLAHELVAEQYRVLNEELLPALATEGIHLLRRGTWTAEDARWIKRHFLTEVLPILTPVGLDPAHPFPRVLNKGLCVAMTVEGKDAFHRQSGVAIVQVPRSLPRLIALPRDGMDGHTGREHAFVMLSSVIHEHAAELFPGMSVTGCFQFRVTRNSDLWVDEEEVDNLLQALQGELPNRKFGAAVRLEVTETCSPEIAQFLLQNVGLAAEDLYRVGGPVNLGRLATIYGLVDRADLKFPPFVPGTQARLKLSNDLFEVIRGGDVLLHHPYESFAPVVQLLAQAAEDPHVLAIKMTLYRTEVGSPVVTALLDAARAGKEVTAVVELRARFDEAANIDLATRLQEAGANVVYGIVGYKAHAKMLLIVRREGRRLRRYVHLGTGNYHPGTARAYTDLGLLTARPEIGTDVHKLFQELTGLGHVARLKCLLRSPFTLKSALLERIGREMDAARAGRKARIIARLNSLGDAGLIQALYEASQAGVSIDLLVRGICCLKPGIPGVSDNIRVRSIVGRFLEHSRVYYFFADGDEEVWCSSADWMERNFQGRFEVCFPILDEELRSRVLAEALELPLADNQQAWQLRSDGSYALIEPGKKQPLRCQRALLDHHSEHFTRAQPSPTKADDTKRRRGARRARRAPPDEEPRSRRA
ncbi:MAG: polyphosphate kinase 1 [Planctomycetes bacterium]|nr:polyphosphate kinase 1 [Planctomycetota bacterium]